MAKEITSQLKKEVKGLVYEFFADECDKDVSELNNDTDIIEDLEGDSLMFLSLLEMVKKKYDLNIELRTIGQYLVRKPTETIGKVIDLTLLIIEHEEGIRNLA